MALVRCDQHGNPKGRTTEYTRAVEPLGYPETAAICGSKGCQNPGCVWLTADESNAYDEGQRIFEFATAVTKIKVK